MPPRVISHGKPYIKIRSDSGNFNTIHNTGMIKHSENARVQQRQGIMRSSYWTTWLAYSRCTAGLPLNYRYFVDTLTHSVTCKAAMSTWGFVDKISSCASRLICLCISPYRKSPVCRQNSGRVTVGRSVMYSLQEYLKQRRDGKSA